MSLFLGKIHYWLFNKILWFQELEDKIMELVKDEKIDKKVFNEKINKIYGEKITNKNLDEIVDKNNIHGWLQSKINSSEERVAAWVKVVLENCENPIKDLEAIFKEKALIEAKDLKVFKNIFTAKEIYKAVNDRILDGMPCDRINEILILEDELVQWKRKICVHKELWNKENIDVEIFYRLRGVWIENFINELNPEFIYIEKTGPIFFIRRRGE